MTVAHTTLLNYLGKHITVDVPVPVEYDQSGFEQISGVLSYIVIHLDGNHEFALADSDYYFFDKVRIKSEI